MILDETRRNSLKSLQFQSCLRKGAANFLRITHGYECAQSAAYTPRHANVPKELTERAGRYVAALRRLQEAETLMGVPQKKTTLRNGYRAAPYLCIGGALLAKN